MDGRYLIIGFLILILGLYLYANSLLIYSYIGNSLFGIIIIFAILIGIIFIIVGLIEPTPKVKKTKKPFKTKLETSGESCTSKEMEKLEKRG